MKNLLISFSGGETSAFMTQWLIKNKSKDFNIVVVFANTGLENEETLSFVEKCSRHFKFKTYWVEAKVNFNQRKSTDYNLVDFKTASRNGEPFEDFIKKYGIPNHAFPACTRETKLNPITTFAREYFGTKDYYTAIGIRIDEIDRISSNKDKNKIIYPLISNDFIPMTKAKINFWWQQQPFRLNLKGYQGNCKTCWKKSDKKLFKIANENPEYFDFMKNMELKYPRVGNEFKKDPSSIDRVFFRGNRSANDILSQSIGFDKDVLDDNAVYDSSESCEVWSNCGDT